MIWRVDGWLGTRLFHPPIIAICQRAGISHHSFSRYAWVVATMTFAARIDTAPDYATAGYVFFAALICATIAVANALLLDYPTRPIFWFRMLLWFIAASQLLALCLWKRFGQDFVWEMAWTILALFGEYAKTIRRIPPRKRRGLKSRPARRIAVDQSS